MLFIRYVVQMSPKDIQLKLIPINKVPVREKLSTTEWIETLKQIPEGQAWATSEEELKLKVGTIKSMVERYVKRGFIPKGYRVTQRTVRGRVFFYVIHDREVDARIKQTVG